MKSASDPRHKRRILIVKGLFESSFHGGNLSPGVQEILNKKTDIDSKIQKAAPQWPIEKINKIDLAILRLSVYEIEYKKIPLKVAVDEAVEIAKKYGAESSPGFVNGVLGAIINSTQYDK